MPPSSASMCSPVSRISATEAHTQGKNLPNTPAHSVSRCGGSSTLAATGRSAM